MAEQQIKRTAWRILCYHAVEPRYLRGFEDQLDWLLHKGWTFCSFDEVWRDARTASGKFVTITFDDGDASVCQVAQKALDARGIKAMLYLATDYAERTVTYRDPSPLPAASWEDVKLWLKSGHQVGSHTHSHSDLTLLTETDRRKELALSRTLMIERLGWNPQHFSYPWGQHNSETHRFLQTDKSWLTAATIDRGWNQPSTDPLRLRRDLASPAWPIARMRVRLIVGATPLLYRLLRRVRGLSPPG
jgi:peptidoglycan/xylan/chitin deacetylase (PgdA/CDA1 family)